MRQMVKDGYVVLASLPNATRKRYTYIEGCTPVPTKKRAKTATTDGSKYMGEKTREKEIRKFEERAGEQRSKLTKPLARSPHISITKKLAAAFAAGLKGIDSEETLRQIKANNYR